MAQIENYIIKENSQLNDNIYQMILIGNTKWIKKPGQFINITIDNLYLKRPISVCDWDEQSLTIVYKVVGKGTMILSQLIPGTTVNTISDCGNGFNVDDNYLVVGGGIGCAPLYGLVKQLVKNNYHPTVILGFSNIKDTYYIDKFKQFNIPLYICSNDGSIGEKGFVTDIIAKYNLNKQKYAACGPKVMLKALTKQMQVDGYLSLEARMGCGFGACMGCSIKTTNGYQRVCSEGPVFESESIIWED